MAFKTVRHYQIADYYNGHRVGERLNGELHTIPGPFVLIHEAKERVVTKTKRGGYKDQYGVIYNKEGKQSNPMHKRSTTSIPGYFVPYIELPKEEV